MALTVVLIFTAATLRIIVFPPAGPLQKADAIVMFDGPTNRLGRALELARAGYAPVLVVSRPGVGQRCPAKEEAGGATVICFAPEPVTTQGEARMAGRLARQHGWRRMILVAERSQGSRARLRTERCFGGDVQVATVDPALREWPRLIAYQWGAMVKAWIWQRDC